ncbi:hypothetical protein MBANPS3_000935 [Mucor bainieri]
MSPNGRTAIVSLEALKKIVNNNSHIMQTQQQLLESIKHLQVLVDELSDTTARQPQQSTSKPIQTFSHQDISADNTSTIPERLLFSFKNSDTIRQFLREFEYLKDADWEDVNVFTKYRIFDYARDQAISDNKRLAFLERCDERWPCQYVIQDEWIDEISRKREDRAEYEKATQSQQQQQKSSTVSPTSKSASDKRGRGRGSGRRS